MTVQLTAIPKRPLSNVAQKIWDAINVIEQQFGASLTHDSGRDKENNKKSTTWIFTFPDYQDAQIAVPMNQGKICFLMRGKTLDGKELETLIDGLAIVEATHTDPKKGVRSSVLGHHAPFLNPSPGNPLLQVIPRTRHIGDLLAVYLGVAPQQNGQVIVDPSLPTHGQAAEHKVAPVSAEELQNQLQRNSEVGQAGELLVVLDELERLRECGCPDPQQYVNRVALTDVARGYDIESTWPGQERCIEVKSTTVSDSDFYITDNERKVLASLGGKGWLYRVLVKPEGSGVMVERISEPMKKIAAEFMTPIVWRVSSEALKNRKN
ncbi:uncharacterized protein DUF3883 [Nitrosospira sp. Nsp2]|uniref:DUF3883 domain-containing protein n=1 Tax=Nitrosospira sp. Nsp2 TaxID=136548 RepID=UPI000D305A42|nr:DUF3883 domain-containing protein [Nitrosospira sp. Nsp2]PTR17228.1 uncharacterized protein DUF3883 [Nitrosospira sp. Nsp2]